MFIYLIANHITGKYYVGQHKGSSLKKYLQDKFSAAKRGDSGRSHLFNSMRAYPDHSVWSIHALRADIQTLEELNQTEIDFIKILRSQDPEYGYNICLGGRGCVRSGWKHTSETRLKMSLSGIGKKHRPCTEKEKLEKSLLFKGRKVTWGDKISLARKGKDIPPESRLRQAASLSKTVSGIGNPNFGHRWNEAQRKKMSQTLATKLYDITCDRCNQTFTAVTRSSYGGHRRKCLRYSNPQSPCLLP